MKSFSKILMFGLILFFLHSCLDYHVITTIHPDGSLDRVVRVVSTDSVNIDSGSMSLIKGEGWVVETDWEDFLEENGDSTRKYVMTARKHFGNFEDLNRELMEDSLNQGKIKIRVSLEKKFRWFYTSYRFTETYMKHFPFEHFPMTRFLSLEEIAFGLDSDDFIYSSEKKSFVRISSLEKLPELTPEDSLQARLLESDIESRMNEWMSKNTWEEFSLITYEALESLEPGLGQLFAARKDSIYSAGNLSLFLSPGDRDAREILPLVSRMMEMNPVEVYIADSVRFERFFTVVEDLFDPLQDSFKNTFLMPGKLLESNADAIDGNACTWNIEFEKFFTEDYNMHAESRISHTWIIVVSILAAILGLLAVIFSFRKRNS